MKYLPLILFLSAFSVNAAKLPAEDLIKKRFAERDFIELNSWKPLKEGNSINKGGTEAARNKFGLFMINNKVVGSTTTVKDYENNPTGVLASFAACSRVAESVLGELTEKQQERIIDMVTSAAKVEGYGLTDKVQDFYMQAEFRQMGKNMVINCTIKGD